MTEKSSYVLRLFIAGETSRARQAVSNIERICQRELRGRYRLEVVDVLCHPGLAEDHKILATPTLIKELPHPMRRIIGDLSDTEKVLLGLDLQPRPDSPAT